jgi:hypothetical protein
MSLSLGIYDQPGGQQLDDWTERAHGAVLRTNEHGFLSATWGVPMGFREAARWYGRSNLHVEWTDRAGRRAWEGRWEDPSVVRAGLTLTALGYWSALADKLHTGLWSVNDFSSWKIADRNLGSKYAPDRYELRQDVTLYMGWKKNETFTEDKRGGFVLHPPHRAAKRVTNLQIRYSANLPAGARIQISSFAYDSITGNPSVISSVWSDYFSVAGTRTNNIANISLPGSGLGVVVEVFYDNGTLSTTSIDSGTYYVEFSTARALGSGTTSCYADQIVSYLLQLAPQLNQSTALIQSPLLDLYDEVYQEQPPAAILAKLARIGDTSNQRWEAAVWEGRLLQFQVQGSRARTWHLELADTLEVQRALTELRNEVYTLQQAMNGRALRTLSTTDLISQARYRLTRQAAVRAQTTDTNSTGQANTQRDAYLADHKEIRPRANLPIARVRDQWGNLYPPYVVRGNDLVVIPELSPLLGESFAQVRKFRVLNTEYHVDTNHLAVRPEVPMPALDVLLTRQEEGY